MTQICCSFRADKKSNVFFPDCWGWDGVWITDLSGFWNNFVTIVRNASSCCFHGYLFEGLLASFPFFNVRMDTPQSGA